MTYDNAMKQAAYTAEFYAIYATDHWMKTLYNENWRHMPQDEKREAILEIAPLVAACITASATDYAAYIQQERNEDMREAREALYLSDDHPMRITAKALELQGEGLRTLADAHVNTEDALTNMAAALSNIASSIGTHKDAANDG